LKTLSKVHIYTEQDSSISAGCQHTLSGTKLRKLKTEMLDVSHVTEGDRVELAILREPPSTGASVADPSLHLDTVDQTGSLGQTRSPTLSKEEAQGYVAMKECPMAAAEQTQ